MVFGEPWRQCFERAIPQQRVGSWGGITSEDVTVGVAGDPNPTLYARVYTPTKSHRSTDDGDGGDGGDGDTVLPVLVYMHGGGHTISHVYDQQYDDLSRELASKGFVKQTRAAVHLLECARGHWWRLLHPLHPPA